MREAGARVEIINLNNEVLKACRASSSESDFNFSDAWKVPLDKAIVDFKPDVIGFTCMFTQTHTSTVKAIDYVKENYPALPLILGGVHVTNCLEDVTTSTKLLDDFSEVDFIFTYEADQTFPLFFDVVEGKRDVSNLRQVFFNKLSPRILVKDTQSPEQEYLDVIPAHDLMTLEELSKHGKIGSFFCHKDKGTRFTTSLANRGCRCLHFLFCQKL